MSLPRYLEYKDSGIEWLGKVPEHWQVTRLQDVAEVINGYPFDARLFDTNGTYPLIRIRDLNASETATRYNGEFVDVAAVTTADVLIGMDGDFNVGRWLADTPALLNQRMCCIRAESSDLLTLLRYALPTPLQAINDVTYATTVKHLSSFQVQKIRFALPSDKRELSAIANFLDRETTKIDGLIAEQEKLITLLAEKRQATISHAVTKGLNPAAPMKDSGVAWLGEVPAHWDASKIKSLCYINDGNHGEEYPEASDYTDETDGVPFIRAGNIKNMKVSSFEMLYITQEKNSSMRKGGLKTGDILFTNRGEIGKVATVSADFNGANLNSQIAYLRPETAHLDRIFTAYFLSSDLVRHVVDSVSAGSVLTQFPIKDLKQIPITLPPLIEQTSIASFLDSETNRLDVLSLEANRGISLLKERRSALISAAVTGKIDVRAADNQ